MITKIEQDRGRVTTFSVSIFCNLGYLAVSYILNLMLMHMLLIVSWVQMLMHKPTVNMHVFMDQI